MSDITQEKQGDLAKLIDLVGGKSYENCRYEDIGEEIGVSTSEVQRLVDLAEEHGLLIVNRDVRPHDYTRTKAGVDFFQKVKPYSKIREKSSSEYPIFTGHYFRVEMPFSHPGNHPDDWAENFLKVNADTENSEYFEDRDTMRFEIEGFTVYLTSERAIVRIEDSIVHSDLAELKFKLVDKVEQVQKWLEDYTIANFDDRFFVRFRINTQHIAIEDSPIHEFIDSYTTFDVVNYEVEDEGDVLLWCDKSEGSKHTEFGGGNRPGNQVLEAQEHAEKVSTLLKSVVRRWDKWWLIIGLVEDGFLDGVYSLLRNNSRRLLHLEKRISELEDKIDTTGEGDSLDSGNSESNSLFIYWAKRLAIKPLISFSLEKEVICMDDFEEVLRQKIQEEVKKQLGLYDTSQRRTENELKDLIQEELEILPKTVTELRNALDAQRSTVINQLEKLAEVGVVEEFEKDGNSYWRQK